jgi:hypothetical protein
MIIGVSPPRMQKQKKLSQGDIEKQTGLLRCVSRVNWFQKPSESAANRQKCVMSRGSLNSIDVGLKSTNAQR